MPDIHIIEDKESRHHERCPLLFFIPIGVLNPYILTVNSEDKYGILDISEIRIYLPFVPADPA